MPSAFETFYRNQFKDRFDPLVEALLKAPAKTALKSPFPSNTSYLLDPASLAPVEALAIESGQSFLDVCSAPGGKALATIYTVKGEIQAQLNDLSPARVSRLKAVLHDFLPEEIVANVRVTCGDGARLGQRRPDFFDRVLADVPCSAERHHLLDNSIAEWSPARSKRMAIRQHALLCSALDSAVSGGRIVYSTCSMSPFENDGVIEKLRKSRKGRFEIGEVKNTEFGRLILPDTDGGGPIYLSVLKKL